jgi:hypothetical protein
MGASAPALAFVVEWRGLVSPNGKRTSLRLMMLSDGSFRTDYGAMETGEMPLVIGYGGPGGSLAELDARLHTWGHAPSGSMEEGVLAEEFGPGRPADIQHLWVRWNGYPEAKAPEIVPLVVGAKLKKGKSISMKVAGSHIESGAVLVVDDGETFPLSKNATGSAWVVTKRAASTPGGRTVRRIWSDGAAHRIAVRNPDGRTGPPVDLR